MRADDVTIKCYRVNRSEACEVHLCSEDDMGFEESVRIGEGLSPDAAFAEAFQFVEALGPLLRKAQAKDRKLLAKIAARKAGKS